VVLLVAAVLLTALVQGLVLQSYVVPTGALSPALEPGDRVLVWKAFADAAPGDLVVVDTTATAAVDRSTPVDDGPVGRVLAAVADLLHVDIGRQDRLGVVASASGDTVTLGAPSPGPVASDDVVGRVLLRIWPLDRLGGVATSDLAVVAG
jgi:signal peptidase I